MRPGSRVSLRAKIVLILAAIVAVYAAVDHVVQRTLVFKSFVQLEEQAARADLKRVLSAIDGERDHLARTCKAAASSEETYRFAAEGNAHALETSILPQAFRGDDLSLLFVCDPRGRVVWGGARDLRRPGKPEIALRDFPARQLSPVHPLMPAPGRPRASGLLLTEIGPMLVASEPITGSDAEAEPRGVLILGKPLDAPLVERLARQSGVPFAVWPIDSSSLPPDLEAVRDEVAAAATLTPELQVPVLRPVDEERLAAFGGISDVRDQPILLTRAEVSRDITGSGARAVRYALTSTIAAGVLLLLVLLNLLQRAVLTPIGALTRHATEISSSEDFTRRIGSDRTDEIGVLAREFDGLIGRIEQSRADLVKAARAAGMSEIATGVLHNVGNVLNSVNVSANLVAERVRGSASNDLAKVVKVLEPHADDLPGFLARDPKGRALLPLLKSIAGELEAERARVQKEIKSMCDGIEHVKELVQAQQGYAGRSGVTEVVSIAEQVDAALSFTGQALQGGGHIEVVREYDPLPACRIDRHRLMEILVNLIQNARQATQEAGRDPRIVLRVRALGHARVRIEVQDNGVGIPPENLARIFTHGFTTKKTGHGFGLHSSANAAREMGASLSATSDGPGHGATFALDLTIATPAKAGAAA
ncbi:MAG: HAMP domain-containing protein [Planctomycetes bacterium]|nr:HAMP domain-containing protein [Planctomycetota bacterium]